MASRLMEIFDDNAVVAKIQARLPYLFQIAELESSRAGKVGMEVGSLREKILIALLIYKFGEENVETDIPITMPEVDVKLFGEPISIKTMTGSGFSGVKISSTVDAQKALKFAQNYTPSCDLLLVRINWNAKGGLFGIPLEAQIDVWKGLGMDYFKLPPPGTNPRGVEISKEALRALLEHKDTRCIEIVWRKVEIKYDPYKRWVDYWKE